MAPICFSEGFLVLSHSERCQVAVRAKDRTKDLLVSPAALSRSWYVQEPDTRHSNGLNPLLTHAVSRPHSCRLGQQFKRALPVSCAPLGLRLADKRLEQPVAVPLR